MCPFKEGLHTFWHRYNYDLSNPHPANTKLQVHVHLIVIWNLPEHQMFYCLWMWHLHWAWSPHADDWTHQYHHVKNSFVPSEVCFQMGRNLWAFYWNKILCYKCFKKRHVLVYSQYLESFWSQKARNPYKVQSMLLITEHVCNKKATLRWGLNILFLLFYFKWNMDSFREVNFSERTKFWTALIHFAYKMWAFQ